MEMLDKGEIHISGGLEQNTKFYCTTEKSMKFKMHAFSGIFHLMFSDYGFQGIKMIARESKHKRGLM